MVSLALRNHRGNEYIEMDRVAFFSSSSNARVSGNNTWFFHIGHVASDGEKTLLVKVNNNNHNNLVQRHYLGSLLTELVFLLGPTFLGATSQS
jgi:hypothetical protein